MNPVRLLSGAMLVACLPAQAQSAPSADAGTRHDWVGHVVPPYPSGWSHVGGGCIGSDDDLASRCRHMIVELRDAQSGTRMVLALESVKSFANPPLSRIAAVLEPDALFDPGLAISYDLCQLRGVDDKSVVAIVRYDDREWLPAREAWRFDAEAGRFAPLPSGDVRCMNEGFGYDG